MMRVDPKRVRLPETGIYVRALMNDKWGSYDIAHLEKDSLKTWLLRDSNTAAQVVMSLLGHRP